MPEAKGVKETKDVIQFLGVLGSAVAGSPTLVAAFKAKDAKAVGMSLLALATGPQGPAVIAAGSNAFDGIGEVVSEIKDTGFLEGIDLLDEGKAAAVGVYTAYKAAHPTA